MLRFQIPLAAAILIALIAPQQGVKSLVPSPTQELQKSSIRSESAQESAQESALPSAPSALPSPADQERIKAEVAEIMAIRKQLGGGVAETLGGLSLEMPGQKPEPGESAKKAPLNYENEFAEFLAQRSRDAIQPAPSAHQLPGLPDQTPTKPNLQRQTMAPPSAGILPMDRQERQESIRHAARMLEEAAATLEEASVYDRADQIRQTASELWRSAR